MTICWPIQSTTISGGSRFRYSIVPMNGSPVCRSRRSSRSGLERSVIQPANGAWRRSKLVRTRREQAEEDRELHEHRQAAAERRQGALLLHQLGLGLALLVEVVGEALLDLVDLRLQALDLALVARHRRLRAPVEREQDQADQHRHQDDRTPQLPVSRSSSLSTSIRKIATLASREQPRVHVGAQQGREVGAVAATSARAPWDRRRPRSARSRSRRSAARRARAARRLAM